MYIRVTTGYVSLHQQPINHPERQIMRNHKLSNQFGQWRSKLDELQSIHRSRINKRSKAIPE